MFFVLGRFVIIPSPVPNTNVNVQYALCAFMAVLFGPVVSTLLALIGHILIDMSFGYGIWWSWVLASAVFGLIVGVMTKRVGLNNGVFSSPEIVRFVIAVIVAHAAAWFVVAPGLDILIYREPANKVFMQGLVAGISNIVTTLIVGLLLCVAYVQTKPKKGSLKKD